MPPAILIFGLGYVGQHLGRSLLIEGWEVKGTTRTQKQANILTEQGFEVIVWEGSLPFPSHFLENVTHILVAIPPDEEGDIVLRCLKTLPKSVNWLGYLSATSVYGNHHGAWVTETTSLLPISERGRQRQLAETQWLDKKNHEPFFPIHIFRLSGIYGPGRSVLESIKLGNSQRLDKPGHVFSRVHIDDIVKVLKVSILNPHPGEIYNVADDEPASTADVIAYGCQLLGYDVPPLIPFGDATVSLMLQDFYAEQKRVSNEKIKTSLGIKLTYPTYREGLKHC